MVAMEESDVESAIQKPSAQDLYTNLAQTNPSSWHWINNNEEIKKDILKSIESSLATAKDDATLTITEENRITQQALMNVLVETRRDSKITKTILEITCACASSLCVTYVGTVIIFALVS